MSGVSQHHPIRGAAMPRELCDPHSDRVRWRVVSSHPGYGRLEIHDAAWQDKGWQMYPRVGSEEVMPTARRIEVWADLVRDPYGLLGGSNDAQP